jgi:hypothetical protein
MAIPSIDQADGTVGFHWRRPDGGPCRLVDLLLLPDAEPHRWLPTHLEALDDLLITVATELAPALGGQRPPTATDLTQARASHVAIDRATREYAVAAAAAVAAPARVRRDLRAGQILGTGVLLSIQCRELLGTMGPSPLAGSLDQPGPGLVSGHARLVWVDEAQRWQGARWIVETESARRLPATLAMLLFDSSGVLKEAAVTEHKDALRTVTDAVAGGPVEPIQASGALDWLLFDWLMAHRDGPQSAAIEIRSGLVADATMIVEAAAASVAVRARFDPDLVALPVS